MFMCLIRSTQTLSNTFQVNNITPTGKAEPSMKNVKFAACEF